MNDDRLARLSAALRHMRDAEHLADAARGPISIDQAYHLAGFAPECARKAALSSAVYDKPMGHGGRASEAVLGMALALDARAHRYDLASWQARYPALARWSERARYEQTGTYRPEETDGLLREAREIVDRIAFALWADGSVPESFAWR